MTSQVRASASLIAEAMTGLAVARTAAAVLVKVRVMTASVVAQEVDHSILVAG